MSMRRYWIISLAIGGGAALLVLALSLGGVFDSATSWLARVYGTLGWASNGELSRFRWIEIPVVAILAPGLAWGIIEATRPLQKILVAALSIVLIGLFSPTLALNGILFDPFAPLGAAVLAVLGGFLYSGTRPGQRKRLLEEALGTRVSAAVFSELLEAPEEPAFGGTTREVTTIVCRLFSPDEAPANPVDRLRMGSLFLRTVSTFLLSRGAYLEEAGPEMVRASFGMLRSGEDHAERACRVALDLRGRLRGLSQECESRWFVPIRWGVGIGTGTMTVGLCGVPGRYFFAGLGGEADFADRLALANQRLGSDLLMGPGSYRLVRERFEVRPLEMLYDPVRRNLAEVYQLLSPAGVLGDEERARRDWFWQGVIRMRERDCEGALDFFSRARTPGVEDAPLAHLTGLAQEGIASPGSRAGRLIREFAEEGHARPISRL